MIIKVNNISIININITIIIIIIGLYTMTYKNYLATTPKFNCNSFLCQLVTSSSAGCLFN